MLRAVEWWWRHRSGSEYNPRLSNGAQAAPRYFARSDLRLLLNRVVE